MSSHSECVQVVQHAKSLPLCRAVYLHVITHNHVAIAFYHSLQFQCVRHLPQFYFIRGDRAPTQDQNYYDALMFVLYVNQGRAPFSFLDAFVEIREALEKGCSQLMRWCGVHSKGTVQSKRSRIHD